MLFIKYVVHITFYSKKRKFIMKKILVLIILFTGNLALSQNTQFKLDFLSVAKSGIGITVEQLIKEKFSVAVSYQNINAKQRCFGPFQSIGIVGFQYYCGANSYIKNVGRESYLSSSVNYYLISKPRHKLALGIFGGIQKFENYTDEFKQIYFEYHKQFIEEESTFRYGLSIIYKFELNQRFSLGLEAHYDGTSDIHSSTGTFIQGIVKL